MSRAGWRVREFWSKVRAIFNKVKLSTGLHIANPAFYCLYHESVNRKNTKIYRECTSPTEHFIDVRSFLHADFGFSRTWRCRSGSCSLPLDDNFSSFLCLPCFSRGKEKWEPRSRTRAVTYFVYLCVIHYILFTGDWKCRLFFKYFYFPCGLNALSGISKKACHCCDIT